MKKITYIKYSGSLELGNHLVYTSGSQDLRTRLFREILKNGVEISIQSPFSIATKQYLETEEGKKYFELKNLKYQPEKITVDSDTDLLIVESGSDNAMFETSLDGKRIPAQAYANQVIKNYKGFVMYLQIDVALNFAFFPERLSKKFLNEFIQYGDYKDLFKDKSWLVVSPAKNVDLFCKNSNSMRANYESLRNSKLINVDNFEFHYCGIDFEEEVYHPIKNAERGLLYIGGERNRIKKLDLYYNSVSENFPIHIYGKWKDDTKQQFPNIHFKGILEKGKPRELYNQYFGSVIIGDLKYEKVKCVSGRFFEVVTACSLPLIDIDLLETTVSDIFDEKLLTELTVWDKESVEDKLKLHNTDYRVDLINECVRQMKQFSPNTSFKILQKIFEQYKNKPTTDMEKLEQVFESRLLEKIGDGTKEDEFSLQIANYHNII